MTNQELINRIITFVANSKDNFVSDDDAIYPHLAGMKIYEAPLIGFASADDELFTIEYKKEGIIHPEYMAPWNGFPVQKLLLAFSFHFRKRLKNQTDMNLMNLMSLTFHKDAVLNGSTQE